MRYSQTAVEHNVSLKMKNIFSVILFLSLAIGGTYMQLHEERYLIATLWAMPFLVITLAFLFPSWKPGKYALEHQFGPSKEKELSERTYHLKMTLLWGIGALTLPAGFALADFFENHKGFVVIASLFGLVFGLPCSLKALWSLFNAFKSKS